MHTIDTLHDFVTLSGDQVVTDSRVVAKEFGKRHADVLRALRKLMAQMPDGGVRNFAHTPVIDAQNGKTYDVYQMTKDGFMLLVMGFTGEKALRVKLAFIEAFNRMMDFIRSQQNGAWERWNAAWLEYRHGADHVSACGRDMRRWRDLKPEHLQRLERLSPQILLPL